MDFSLRSESVDVEQIMEQIRTRIREKRGVDYTEQQLRELAAVKLEKFLDPRGVRSDLLQRFKEGQPQYDKPILPLYSFEDATIYETHRGLLQWIRKLLNPVLKLLFNPNPIIHVLHAQAEINRLNLEREEAQEKRRLEMESLYYEIIHNLVFEMTRTGIEVKNLKMRVESLASRLEFNERRARALESVVVYRPASEASEPGGREAGAEPEEQGPFTDAPGSATSGGGQTEGPGQRSRRRRRRRGRRSGPPASVVMGESRDAQRDTPSNDTPSERSEQTTASESPSAEPPVADRPAPSPHSAPEAAADAPPPTPGSSDDPQ
jgi:hypothetical protein